ncbi:moronecidin-like [Poecilia latipinna]|uniref:moronecidin-like n=1 Tax=Poecilia formosa TaxID=48698 RepID=UPI000443DBFE|nr:PREDICTED: moronecidin-like [Poecilia formosa]XP_014833472.1 PREDICTED: moronecidin-like [Poecilia mexicana]XP_014894227.1 PREDICTED: moronecidin-like [Poecilia latipinna]
MKCSVAIFVLSVVVLAAQPGEGFFHLIPDVIKGVSHGIHGLAHLIRGPGNNEVQADQQQLDQQEMDQQQLDQQQLDQQEMNQQQKDEQQLNKRSFKYQAVKHRIA